jgi:hypothetical protein
VLKVECLKDDGKYTIANGKLQELPQDIFSGKIHRHPGSKNPFVRTCFSLLITTSFIIFAIRLLTKT